MGDMVFDLVCRGCGGRNMRRWSHGELVTVTYCPACQQGMSVIGIAFFAPSGADSVTQFAQAA
jgi:hypothetical protein